MSMTATTAFFTDLLCAEHFAGAGHPESPERYHRALAALEGVGLPTKMMRGIFRDASHEELLRVHGAAYLDLAKREVESGARQLSTGDTGVSWHSWQAAVRAAGCAAAAVDAVCAKGSQVPRAFCLVRPPGHHANANRGMGFCLLNNVAVAARHAQHVHGLSRVAIVDWDVHHGNGTQDIFYADPTVHFFSTHQSPWYPGTGARSERGSGAGVGFTLNCPFPAGAGAKEVCGAFNGEWMTAMREFRPELVLISAGFDSRAGDPLGGFLLTDPDFVALTKTVRSVAEEHASGRVVSMLEGGYNLEGLSSAVVAHVTALL
jgi:acetoin utilization deacetylase AcuC-like enzyme